MAYFYITNYNRLTGFAENTQNLSGKAVLSNGTEVKWSATKTAPFVIVKDTTKPAKLNPIIPVTFPNIGFGNVQKPLTEIIRHPIVSSDEENERNPRARSAKLRIAEKNA